MVAAFLVGTLYVPKISNYARNAGVEKFFEVRRKYLFLVLPPNLLLIPLALAIPYMYLLDIFGYWRGEFLAPIASMVSFIPYLLIS